jgi:alpha-beta hydrolase superfamily lysophospholipase
MRQELTKIANIPAVVWGEKSDKVYIAVHGKMSDKYEAAGFAEKAEKKGYQTVSFDLPEHGDRKGEDYPCMIWNGVHDLKAVGDHVLRNWNNVSLYASSLGAYFSLLAYKGLPLEKGIFLSPVLDMARLIQNLMAKNGVSERELKEKQEIKVPGDTLYWDYYSYARDNPVVKWDASTAILYGAADDITEPETVEDFMRRFNCGLTVLKGGEHWFHTERQLAFLDKWLDEKI